MKAFFSGVSALTIVGCVSVGLALGAKWGLSWMFDGVNPTVSAAIVAAAATTLVSVLGVTLGRYLERRHQIDLELRARKIPIYMEFVEGLLRMLDSGDDDTTPGASGRDDEEPSFELVSFLRRMTPQLMIWASNDVVDKWSRFRRGADKHPPMEYMFMLEDLLTAIRKDLGHSGDLSKGDLLGFYINDIDEHLPSRSK